MFFDLSDKQSLTTKVYNHIRNGILDGSYKDGDFLVETRLAEELEVSILKAVEENGEEILVTIDDDTELENVYQALMDLIYEEDEEES